MGKWRSKRERLHAIYYANLLYELDQQYRAGGEGNIKAALAAFDTDWKQIQTGQEYAQINATSSKTALALCSDYPGNGSNLLGIRQPPEQRIEWLQTALDAMRSLNLTQSMYDHLEALSDTYADFGDYTQAERIIREALTLVNEANTRGHLLVKLGAVQDSQGLYHEALVTFGEALAIYGETGERHGKALLLSYRGIAYDNLGQMEIVSRS